ncbi:MAG: O-antigen ligase family protein, partial [Phycisphaeraceae bacterium]|nr:O-antigen ligase family protein [Phycisphaeraceae bacterium]
MSEADPHAMATDSPEMGLGLRLLAAMLVVPAAIRLLVPATPETYFDVDPRSAEAPLTSLMIGPALSVWLDGLAILLAAGALAVVVRRGKHLRMAAVGLAIAGTLVAACHLFGPVTSAVRVASWMAAVAVALAAYHVARWPGLGKLMLVLLLAFSLPALLDAGLWRWVEHPDQVAYFQQNEAEILRSRGWAEGSPQHQLFVRRMMRPDVTGAYGLSNVYASVLAAIAAGALAIVVVGRSAGARTLLPAIWLLAAAVTLGVTYSRGGVVAAAVGVVVLVAWVGLGTPRRRRWLAGGVGLMILAALGLVIGRGVAGGGTVDDPTLSLLFRAHYFEGAWRAIGEQPAKALTLGLGPDGFAAAYLRNKPMVGPEEVGSTHSVLVDWLVMLGVGGVAWAALWLGALWTAVRGAADVNMPAVDGPAPGETGLHDLLPVCLVALVVFGGQLLITHPGLSPDGMFVLLGGMAAMIVTGALGVTPGWIDRRVAAVSAMTAAVVIAVHAQVEMTFFHAGGAHAAWLLLAVAAGLN